METKNAVIVRKHIGWGRINTGHADQINGFYREHLNPYLNHHRPSAQAEVQIDARGANSLSPSVTPPLLSLEK